ncbi:MAG: ABC transporter permease, partial [Candidatus Sifarchaeia archaeon]
MKLGFMEIQVQKRSQKPDFAGSLVIRLLSFVMGLGVVAVIFLVQGVNPLLLYLNIFRVAFFTQYGLAETLSRMIPLLLIGLGLAVSFRAKIDNIGAEGQFLVGAIAATGIAFTFSDLPSVLLIPLMFAGGFAMGALWAIPVALFRVKGEFKGSDVVLSFLMVFPAFFLIQYLVNGPWKDPEGWGFTQSPLFPLNAQIFRLPGTRIHLTILLALALTFLVYYYLVRTKEGMPETKLGYEIDIMGENPEAGEAVGINFLKIALFTMIISGGFAGLAGVGEAAGTILRLRPEISTGLGFTGIVVAWLGGLNPIGVLVSSVFFAGILAG